MAEHKLTEEYFDKNKDLQAYLRKKAHTMAMEKMQKEVEKREKEE